MKLRFFDQPIHPAGWQRPSSGTGVDDYRVTNHFWSPDILNGGTHRATDIGNAREGYPVLTPGPCEAMGLKHFDGALGVRMADGNGGFWSFWHLDSVSVPTGTWTPIDGVRKVGTTGNTGAKLPNGSPMPAHTHIELVLDNRRIDPEPFLLGDDYPWTGDMVICKPAREQWKIPAGTPFWTEGPEMGPQKEFTSLETRWSNGETSDGSFRRIEYGSEELWIKRADIVPVSGTRNPASGYGSPSMGASAAQVKSAQTQAADKVLEAAKAAAKTYGAS